MAGWVSPCHLQTCLSFCSRCKWQEEHIWLAQLGEARRGLEALASCPSRLLTGTPSGVHTLLGLHLHKGEGSAASLASGAHRPSLPTPPV